MDAESEGIATGAHVCPSQIVENKKSTEDATELTATCLYISDSDFIELPTTDTNSESESKRDND